MLKQNIRSLMWRMVRPKMGGLEMLVTSISFYKDRIAVTCKWFDEDRVLHMKDFDLEEIELTESK